MTGEGVRPKIAADRLYATDINKTPYKLASGTVTVATSTTTYNVDYADISIAVGELAAEDIIKVTIVGDCPGNQGLSFALYVQDTSQDGGIASATMGSAGENFTIEARVTQDVTTNDLINGSWNYVNETSTGGKAGTADTNDANIMTTAWSLRLNFLHVASSSAATTVRYVAWVVKGE